jgi:leucyl-tRNA synthetase
MYDLPQQVVCRCMTHCIVKILSDQWFLNYSDPQWKTKAKEVVAQMTIYPDSAKQSFYTVIDWLREWACARTTGFGTPLPWGKGWIIETLSDSTVYMAFYTINKHIKQNEVKPEALRPEFFDYVFYGKGSPDKLEKTVGIKADLLKSMRSEFLYWYPFDLRNSAKELVTNHLTFCIFHHAALFPPEHWPKAIGVNGMLMVEGQGMHKSKGNFVTMKGAVEKYGADATRCALLLGAEGMDDPDWRAENVSDLKGKFEGLLSFASVIILNAKKEEKTTLERWLISRLQHRIKEVTASLDELKTRTALQTALFETWNDLRWYIQRKGNSDAKLLREAVMVWLKMLAPFAPFLTEELWSRAGEPCFISVAQWPVCDEAKIDIAAEEQENQITDVMSDTSNILKAMKITPKRVCYYTAALWKWNVYLRVLEKTLAGEAKIGELMREFAADKDLKLHMKDIAGMVPKVIKALTKLPSDRKANILKIKTVDEKQLLISAIGFLKERFNAEVSVSNEEDNNRYDPKQRAAMAIPYQPAIFVE